MVQVIVINQHKENVMRGSRVSKIIIAGALTFALQGCVWSTTQTTMNAVEVTVAAMQFDSIKEAVEANWDKFTPTEQASLEQARIDLDEVVATVTADGNIVNLAQIKMLRDAVKVIYQNAEAIIIDNLHEFNVRDRANLLSFQQRMNNIDTMIITLEAQPVSTGTEDLFNSLAMAASLLSKILPLVI